MSENTTEPKQSVEESAIANETKEENITLIDNTQEAIQSGSNINTEQKENEELGTKQVETKIETANETNTQELQSSLPSQNEEEKELPLEETKEIKTDDTVSVENKDKIQSSSEEETPEDKEKDNKDTSSSTDNKTAQDEENNEKDSSKDEYAEHVTYTEDGTAIYTDPKTKYQYKWCTIANNWIPNDKTTSTNPYENEHYKWCSETQKWIPKQTQVTETEYYKWDAEKKAWVPKTKDNNKQEQSEIVYDIDEDGQRTYTDKDGTVFFWDVEKNAWFPKIDEDFMARYQMSYGFIDNTSESEKEKQKRELEAAVQKEKELAKMVEEAKANEEASRDNAKQGVKRKQPQEPPKWFEIDPAHNTKVYVSNLPLDITLEEFAEVMGKCGMIMRDPQTQKYKLKLYTEADGQIKGDGLCDYIKVESVDLALKILDEYNLRGHKIRVQRAQFQMRGEYNPALKPKRKKKDKEKLAKIKEKLFDWRPEKMRGERSKHERSVIIKNLFHPDLFEKEVQLILDYQNDLREECSKCGTVRKVIIYDRHSEGVAQVNMSTPEEADLVIQMMHGRFFGKRQLTAEHWDGKTKYKIEETEEEIQKRLNKWDQYLESEENKKSELPQADKESETESKDVKETCKTQEIQSKETKTAGNDEKEDI